MAALGDTGTNPGVYPPDLSSDVGMFRALVGDLNAEEFVPAVPGVRNYEKFSDAEIEAYLSRADDNVSRAVGLSYIYLAGQAAMESVNVKDYDLSADLTKRSADLREIAKMWFDRADEEDLSSGEDAFEIVNTGTRSRFCYPEAMPRRWGMC